MELSYLENLCPDALITVLSACESFADLASFIRASPLLLHTFLAAKSTVLLEVVSNILGPATRDAAFLAMAVEFPDSLSNEGLNAQIDEVILAYKARLRVTSPPWAWATTEDIAVAMVHITRIAELWVDIYAYIHFRRFEDEIDQSPRYPRFPHKPQLSWTERGRLAQAVLRQQIVTLIAGGPSRSPQHYLRVGRAMAPLFHPWEWHQISDINAFFSDVPYQLTQCKRLYTWWNTRFETLHLDPSCSLKELAERFIGDVESNEGLLDDLCDYRYADEYKKYCPARLGRFELLKGSHHFADRSTSENTQLQAPGGTKGY
ncbi:hypothetical protein NLG97_g9750 [Lecanicillium saksenae]|uniref:Uncharacterized protein n=1 Tax=Lecanicillium saksenae TaxID=468837 RepID=A0ACC1QID4_9HYPO|nr:hypothetical protein NLG97_g9750 [Lecanicillium saksenae]